MISNNYALTPGHSLNASWILHVNLEGIKTNASKIFKYCFEAAEKNQLNSLAMPTIGTGGKSFSFSLNFF